MDVIPGGSQRPAYYDRNTVNRNAFYEDTNIPPHASTSRASYTVPAAKKAMLETVSLTLRRRQAGTVGGRTVAFLSYTPSGGSNRTILSDHMPDGDFATVGAVANNNLSFAKPMSAGDAIALTTLDETTGGSLDWFLNAALSEFDA